MHLDVDILGLNCEDFGWDLLDAAGIIILDATHQQGNQLPTLEQTELAPANSHGTPILLPFCNCLIKKLLKRAAKQSK